jgi:hypothetical protein
MKIDYVINGSVSFVLTPENDMDKAALKEIAKNPVTIKVIGQQDKTQILNKIIPEGIIIEPTVKEN